MEILRNRIETKRTDYSLLIKLYYGKLMGNLIKILKFLAEFQFKNKVLIEICILRTYNLHKIIHFTVSLLCGIDTILVEKFNGRKK